MKQYTIYYMRGNVYHIMAYSESQAFKLLWVAHPECRTWDLLKVEVEELKPCG